MNIQYVDHEKVRRILKCNWMGSLISEEISIPTCLIGAVGVGKTTAAKTFGHKLREGFGGQFRVITFHASMIEATDLGGFPHIVSDQVEYAMMKLLPFDSKEPALIIFDEIDRAPIDVQNACTELLHGGCIHGHQLSPNAYIVATMNGISDTHTNELSKAVINRMCNIYVTSKSANNMESWTEWAIENDIDSRIIGFAKHEPDIISENEEFEELSFYSSRSRDYLSYVLKAMDKIKEDTGDDSKDIMLPIFAGLVGSSVAAKLMAYLTYFTDLPSLNEILKNPNLLIEKGISTDTAKLTAFISSTIQKADSDERAIEMLVLCKYIPKEIGAWFIHSLEKSHPNIITSNEYKEIKQ